MQTLYAAKQRWRDDFQHKLVYASEVVSPIALQNLVSSPVAMETLEEAARKLLEVAVKLPEEEVILKWQKLVRWVISLPSNPTLITLPDLITIVDRGNDLGEPIGLASWLNPLKNLFMEAHNWLEGARKLAIDDESRSLLSLTQLLNQAPTCVFNEPDYIKLCLRVETSKSLQFECDDLLNDVTLGPEAVKRIDEGKLGKGMVLLLIINGNLLVIFWNPVLARAHAAKVQLVGAVSLEQLKSLLKWRGVVKDLICRKIPAEEAKSLLEAVTTGHNNYIFAILNLIMIEICERHIIFVQAL